MADGMDSDTCIGSKRSVEDTQTVSPIPDPLEIAFPLEPDLDFNPKLSPFLVSDSPKKLKISPDSARTSHISGFQDSNMGFVKESLVSNLVEETKEKESLVCDFVVVGIEVGLSGIQEPKKGFTAENLLDVKKMQLLEQVEAMAGEKVTALKVEVIETVPMGCLGRAQSGPQRCAAKQEVTGKKARNQRRKEKLANGFKPEKNTLPVSSGANNNNNNNKITYSRMELEAMRFVSIAEQRKLWKDVYNGLGPAVAREYDDMAVSKQQQNIQFNSDHRNRFGESLGNLVNNDTQDIGLDPVCSFDVTNGDGYPIPEKDFSEDDDSDDEYASIQRPAFWVDGEPNFESGSPEDGFEYLRRVRWEAAQIPKVRVAKVDRSKFNREQSDYMPKIPEIAKCPEQLLPLKQWEDAFLSEFSELRLGLSRFEGSSASTSENSQAEINLHKDCTSHQPQADIVSETFAHVKSIEVDCTETFNQQSSTAEGGSASPPVESFSPKSSVDHSSRNSPLLSVIFRLDSVARVSMLRKRIKAAEDTSTLSRDDCLWLFALCAVIDTPVDADTSASLRSLLRKCAALRATKSTVDDELEMLNILATISGRYFGQSEH
ncbi:uncharacterized protein LOC126790611 [Argentina anserina]|uniref:uncharacterized protein LOC126790611 n=1 Tax=Argentina anserina TaxID=57926 RepID=UPI00217670FD|nr:uncharacterized protein LOC126790611 [Potentilla anserina]